MFEKLKLLTTVETNKYVIFSLVAFIIVGLLRFAYHSKKRVETSASRVFVMLMGVAFITILSEILGNVILPLYGVNDHILEVFDRIYLILLQTFVMHMVIYTEKVCDTLAGYNKSKKIVHIIFYTFALSAWVVLAIAPINLVFNSDHTQVMYMSGKSTTITFWYCFTYLLFAMYYVLRSQINIRMKELIPIYFYCMIGVIVAFLYRINNSNIFLSFGQSLILFTMYLTIQNPDLHLVESLNVQKETADRANAAKSNFLSSMSHEIRTPLNMIVGLSEDISKESKLPDEVKEDANDIVSASKTLLEIINNIMDINKIESGKMEVVTEPYNIREELRPIFQELSKEVNKDVFLNINFAEDIPYLLLGDKNHLKTIVRNLLTNSIKFTTKGHINVNIKCINNFVNNESILMMSFEDTGEGIRAEDIKNLFDKYHKIDSRRTNTISGAGLGLAITKSLLELQGGTINVQSQFGIGSIFVAQIPQKIANNNAETENDITGASFDGKKVLLVDDNQINIKVAKRTLESLDLKVVSCSSGQECINRIRSGEVYDVILLDMLMPNLTGEDTFAILQKIEGFHTPVVILTADESFGAEEKYLSEGFADYIVKPFSKERVNAVFNKLLDSTSRKEDDKHDI